MDSIKFLALLTLFSNIVFVGTILFFVYTKVTGKRNQAKKYYEFLIEHFEILILLLSATATFGSLYLSEIKKLTPCLLCWYQRIFMYPTTVLLAAEYLTKTKKVHLFLLPLSFIGGLIAIYHYSLQINPNPYAPCETLGYSVSCSDRFVTHFGYITIPWMAFSAFVIIFSLSILQLKSKKVVNLLS